MPSEDSLSEILDRALCPISLFEDDYPRFVRERSQRLADYATELID